MDDQQKNWQKADGAVSDLSKDFTIVGKHRVHSWYAWAIVGIVFGMALGIIYVANRSGRFDDSAAKVAQICPFHNTLKAPRTEVETIEISADAWETYEMVLNGGQWNNDEINLHDLIEDAIGKASGVAVKRCEANAKAQLNTDIQKSKRTCDVTNPQPKCYWDPGAPDVKCSFQSQSYNKETGVLTVTVVTNYADADVVCSTVDWSQYKGDEPTRPQPLNPGATGSNGNL